MSDLTELFEVNSDQVLRFFFTSLKEENLPRNVTDTEVAYVAKILARYAQTSCKTGASTSRTLSDIFDKFVLPISPNQKFTRLTDPKVLETAGSQILFWVGFFRDQMYRKHNVTLYDQLGQLFYDQASNGSKGEKKETLRSVANNFPIWTMTCNALSKTLRDIPHLFNPDKTG